MKKLCECPVLNEYFKATLKIIVPAYQDRDVGLSELIDFASDLLSTPDDQRARELLCFGLMYRCVVGSHKRLLYGEVDFPIVDLTEITREEVCAALQSLEELRRACLIRSTACRLQYGSSVPHEPWKENRVERSAVLAIKAGRALRPSFRNGNRVPSLAKQLVELLDYTSPVYSTPFYVEVGHHLLNTTARSGLTLLW